MGRAFLTFFHQLSLKEKPSSTFVANEAVRVLTYLVTDDIRKLETSLLVDHHHHHHLNSLTSLQWCTALVNLLRKLHFHFLCFVQQFNNNSNNNKNPKPAMQCTEEYMKETLILLDFCNALKSAIAKMNRYCLLVDFAAEKLLRNRATPSNYNINKCEIQRLKKESKKLYVMENHKSGKLVDFTLFNTKSNKLNINSNNIAGVVYAVKDTMNTLCSLLFSTVFYPVSIKLCTKSFPDELSASLRNVLCRFSELGFMKNGANYKKCGKPILVENIMTVFDIKANYVIDEEKYLMNIDLLKNNCLALKEGLEMFEFAVTELFEEAVKGRNKVLAMIADV